MVEQAQRAIRDGKDLAMTPKHWFCIAATRNGDIFKSDADTPTGFLEALRGASVGWVDYWAEDLNLEAPVAAGQMGFSSLLVTSLLEPAITYQDFDTEMGFRVPAIHVTGFDVQSHNLMVLMKTNFIFTIHPLTVDRRFARLRRYSDAVLRKIRAELSTDDKLTTLLIRLVDENNNRNFEYLRQIDQLGDDLNKRLIDASVARERLGTEIYLMKHALIAYLNSLWETMDVLHDLRFGDAEIITNDPVLLDQMSHLADDVNRQIALSEHMSEVLASGLEVMQSIYNNQLQVLNNRLALVMTYLTIVGTAVLVPNTLATILSNPAYNLGPGDVWWYTVMLILSTVFSTYGVYWWMKRMGYLPKRMD